MSYSGFKYQRRGENQRPRLVMPGSTGPIPGQSGTEAPAVPTPSRYAKPGPYRTNLSPVQEQAFQQWVKSKSIPYDPSPTSDYDMRGFFQDKPAMQEREARIARGGSKHFPDTYKTPYHATFSNESTYATPDAPHWENDRLIDKTGKVIADESAPASQANQDEDQDE